jgi:hypothetical protein
VSKRNLLKARPAQATQDRSRITSAAAPHCQTPAEKRQQQQQQQQQQEMFREDLPDGMEGRKAGMKEEKPTANDPVGELPLLVQLLALFVII